MEDYVDNRTESEIDEMYRRDNEAGPETIDEPWWNTGWTTGIILLALCAVVIVCIYNLLK